MNSNSLPEPTIEVVASGMKITCIKDIFSEEYLTQLGLNDIQVEAVKYAKENGKITNKEYQAVLKVSRITVTRDLTELVENNILRSSVTKYAGSIYVLVIAS